MEEYKKHVIQQRLMGRPPRTLADFSEGKYMLDEHAQSKLVQDILHGKPIADLALATHASLEATSKLTSTPLELPPPVVELTHVESLPVETLPVVETPSVVEQVKEEQVAVEAPVAVEVPVAVEQEKVEDKLEVEFVDEVRKSIGLRAYAWNEGCNDVVRLTPPVKTDGPVVAPKEVQDEKRAIKMKLAVSYVQDEVPTRKEVVPRLEMEIVHVAVDKEKLVSNLREFQSVGWDKLDFGVQKELVKLWLNPGVFTPEAQLVHQKVAGTFQNLQKQLRSRAEMRESVYEKYFQQFMKLVPAGVTRRAYVVPIRDLTPGTNVDLFEVEYDALVSHVDAKKEPMPSLAFVHQERYTWPGTCYLNHTVCTKPRGIFLIASQPFAAPVGV